MSDELPDHHGVTSINPFAAWVLQQSGLDPAAYRPKPIERRVLACLRQLRVFSTHSARRLLDRSPWFLPVALDALLVGVSEFFRDPAVFERLQFDVLPELLRTHRGIRVYSAGVSAGQELYSVAILLDTMQALEPSELLGVDCRPQAIAEASAGIFSEQELAGLTATQRDTYFRRQNGRRVASPRLGARLDWRCASITEFSEPQPRQLVLFRNVAIYLQPQAEAEMWTHLYGQLETGGFLVTGKAEQPPATLPLTRIARSIYRKD